MTKTDDDGSSGSASLNTEGGYRASWKPAGKLLSFSEILILLDSDASAPPSLAGEQGRDWPSLGPPRASETQPRFLRLPAGWALACAPYRVRENFMLGVLPTERLEGNVTLG